MKRLFAGLLLGSAVLTLPAQVGQPPHDGTPSVSTGSVPLTYTGGDSRVSIGLDQDGNTQGELMGVFANNGERAVVAQFWWGNGGAGGIQSDYNWLWGTTLEQLRQDPDSATVAKLSFALDQNAQKDRQANVGFAIERKEFFLNLFLSGKASGARNAGQITTQQQTIQNGSDAVGNYTQTITELATTPLQTQPYTYTVGVHGGHFSDALTARFNGGIDYAKGNAGAHQTRMSIGIDKYLGVRGWSLSALAEHSNQDNPDGTSRGDNRTWLFLRYEFGGGGAFSPIDSAGQTAWIQRALRNPVSGHSRSVDTYVTRGKTTTTSSQGPKQYTARRPIAKDDSASVAGDSTSNAIEVLANDSDPDGGTLSISAVTAPAHGSAQVSGSHITYTPTPGFVGNDTFDYTISNSKGLTASAHVTVSVTAVVVEPAKPPVARNDTAATPYATAITIAVLANDSDPNGYPLAVASATAPAHGAAHINADGTITYTPASTFAGADTFSYSIDNGHGGSASATVTITVRPPAPPIARDDSATTPFATPVVIAVLANDSDPAGFPLSVTSAGPAADGTVQVNADGSVTYSPAATFVGSDSFPYTISNGHGGSASAKVSVTVLAPQGTLSAIDDTAKTPYATAVVINLLANDSGPAGLTLSITQVTAPAHGTVQIGTNGFVNYKPSPSFNGGLDTFVYTVSDGLDVATATVTVTVLPPGQPVAQNDNANTPFNTPVSIAVLANDSDPNGFTLSVTQVGQPAHGSAQINPDKSVTYTPATNYFGADSFSYTIDNGHGGTASATVSINVQQPLPPIAVDDSPSTAFGTPVVIHVLSNDSDPNGLPLSVVSATAPGKANASAVVNPDNTITYTPDTDSSGADSFNYTITNGFKQASATVTVTVQPPLPPVAKDDAASTPFDTPVQIDVFANDTTFTGTKIVLTVSTGAHGTASFNGSTIKYTPGTFTPPQWPDPVPFVGVDTFTYELSDGFGGATSTATVTVTVQLPAPPVAVDDNANVNKDGSMVSVPVVANDTHQAGYGVLVIDVSAPSSGDGNSATPATALIDPGAQSITYTSPDPSFLGDTDSFTYTIRDPYMQSAIATVHINNIGP